MVSVRHKAFMVLVQNGFPRDSVQQLLQLTPQDGRRFVAEIKAEYGVDLSTGGKIPVPDYLKSDWDKTSRVGKAELEELNRELGGGWVKKFTRVSPTIDPEDREDERGRLLEELYCAYRLIACDAQDMVETVERRMRELGKLRVCDGAGTMVPWSDPNSG